MPSLKIFFTEKQKGWLSIVIELPVLILSILVILLIEGFFAGSEIALLSADSFHLRAKSKAGSQRARAALDLVLHPERVLSTTLVMTNICMIGTSVIITLFLIERHIQHAELLAILITSPLIVLFGELIPKTIFQRNATRLAPWVALPLMTFFWLLFPITKLISLYTSRLSRLVSPIDELFTGRAKTTREELRTLVQQGTKDSGLKSSESLMIKRIFDFKDTEAKHALIPLLKVNAISCDSTIRDSLENFKEHRHSRMPIFEERIDNIVGILEYSDLLVAPDIDAPISPFVSPAVFVPETQSLNRVLNEMSREDIELMVVVDEYGGAIGILTFEDVVEEIVGEIKDEYEKESARVRQIGPGRWLVQARVEIESINEQLGLEIPKGEYETLAGFLLQQFGGIPESGDELFFDPPSGTLRFSIQIASPKAIESVLIERIQTERTPIH
jgi:putative hemolysin